MRSFCPPAALCNSPTPPFVGDVDLLPNGNIMIVDGGLTDPGADFFLPTNVRKWARPIEVTHDSPAEVQWELRVQGAPVGDPGWTVYRAFYVESLQPSTAR